MTSPPIIEVAGLAFRYPGGKHVLSDINLTLAPGEMYILLGPNGAGKSTLLDCVAGLSVPQSGVVKLNGVDIRGLDPRQVAREIAYVPQTAAAAFSYPVREYVAMGRAPHLGMFGRPGARDYDIADTALETMGIGHLADSSYTRISGGERQMTNICRAIAQQPKLVLFDEPTSALDFGNQLRVLKVIKGLSERGYSVLMTTHNPDHPNLLESRVGILERSGRLTSGSAGELMDESLLSRIYEAKLHIVHIPELDRTSCLSEKL